jgi:hypothetical protein
MAIMESLDGAFPERLARAAAATYCIYGKIFN